MDNSDGLVGTLIGIAAYVCGFLAIFGIALWCAQNSSKNRVSFISPAFQNYDPIVWFFICAFFCGLGPIYYLVRRNAVIQSREIATQPKADTNIESQLEELKKLHERGLITDGEFNLKKSKILNL